MIKNEIKNPSLSERCKYQSAKCRTKNKRDWIFIGWRNKKRKMKTKCTVAITTPNEKCKHTKQKKRKSLLEKLVSIKRCPIQVNLNLPNFSECDSIHNSTNSHSSGSTNNSNGKNTVSNGNSTYSYRMSFSSSSSSAVGFVAISFLFVSFLSFRISLTCFFRFCHSPRKSFECSFSLCLSQC